jgi:hypothetical protein
VASSCDGGDVSVVEVDRLVQSAAEGDGESGEDVLPGDLAAFDLRYSAFGDAHAVGDLLLGHAAGSAYLGEAVSDDLSQQFALASLDGGFAAGAVDVSEGGLAH